LRKLVEAARRANGGEDRRREAEASAYRFMAAMAEPGFEQAARALFRGNHDQFTAIIARWPRDVADYVEKLSASAFADRPADATSHPRR
jgi:hypothetical protein